MALDYTDIQTQVPERPRRVYVNRNLRMDSIRAVGFDMDYTLARYKSANIEGLAYSLACEKLVARGYPAELKTFQYDPHFVIRGLTADSLLGNLIKLDRHNHPARVFHGRKLLNQLERRTLYRREKIVFTPPRFALADTLFSLPEMCLYADLVEYVDHHAYFKPSYTQLFEDTRTCIDEAHQDDTLKSVIKNNLSFYLDKDPDLAKTLHKIRSSGKKIFVLTNSLWDYTQAVMSYLLNDELAEYNNWQSYFDTIIVGASKPLFFTEKKPFVQLTPLGQPLPQAVTRFEKSAIYQSGNLHDLQINLQIFGEEILYIGDHIYGDILRSKKTSLWRTALVVEELEDEITTTMRHPKAIGRLADLEKERQRLDDLLNRQRQYLSVIEPQTEPKPNPYEQIKAERDQAKQEIKQVLAEMTLLERQVSATLNTNWGMIFKEQRENSRFGDQVASYACIYTSRVTNFLNYSSYQYFRSPRDLLPHERD